MIVKLTTGTEYDLTNSDAFKRLKTYIPLLINRKKADELAKIRRDIEALIIIHPNELEIYRLASTIPVPAHEFKTGYYQPSAAEKLSPNNRYTIINNQLYRLPQVEDEENMVYALIDKYIYERRRNEQNSDVCLQLRRAINKFIPGSINQSDKHLKMLLEEQESACNSYFGDCLSENSDSDAEKKFKRLEAPKREKKLMRASNYRSRANAASYSAAMDGRHNRPINDFKTRPVIHRSQQSAERRRQINDDLKRINDKLDTDGKLPADFLENLNTKFAVAQYRGIHYITSHWDKTARREHREKNELDLPQYSSAVFKSCGVNSYHEYLDRLRNDPDFPQALQTAANKILQHLLLMQHSDPVCYDNFAYVSLFHLMQYWYSANYSAFPERIAADLQKAGNSFFKLFLDSSERPLLSTADIPYHALKYAYGLKLYEGYQTLRLSPRWRADGQAERPYSGKVYVSLHPLSDYTDFNPSHVTSMFKKGLLKLTSIISAERETSFLGFLHKDRVAIQYVAKYPSFKGKYKSVYEYKYGVNKVLYEKIKSGFESFDVHSQERENLELMLGEYLCAYQEVRLIDKANRKAEKSGKVLIYRNENGKFSLYHPETPTTGNKRLNAVIKAKRALYEALAPKRDKVIRPLDKRQIQAQLAQAVHFPPLQRNIEWMRFYGSKNPNQKVSDGVSDGVEPVRIVL